MCYIVKLAFDVDMHLHFYQVLQFLFSQKQSKRYILVHCTHGHNRTGYMIVHYLMRTLSISVTQVSFFLFIRCCFACCLVEQKNCCILEFFGMQAIKLFADVRPPGIYKPDYIDALYNFYHERKPEMVACPPTPEWKRPSDLDLNGDVVPDDDDDGGSAAPLLVRIFWKLYFGFCPNFVSHILWQLV